MVNHKMKSLFLFFLNLRIVYLLFHHLNLPLDFIVDLFHDEG